MKWSSISASINAMADEPTSWKAEACEIGARMWSNVALVATPVGSCGIGSVGGFVATTPVAIGMAFTPAAPLIPEAFLAGTVGGCIAGVATSYKFKMHQKAQRAFYEDFKDSFCR